MPFVLAIICIHLREFSSKSIPNTLFTYQQGARAQTGTVHWQRSSKHKCHLAKALSIRQILLVVSRWAETAGDLLAARN